MSLNTNNFSNSILSALMDKKIPAQNEFSPQLITNNPDEKVKTHIEQELRTCTGFTFAVAFISNAVLTDLKVTFADLARRNITGRILTSTYLAFNQPKVFEELLKIPNVEVRIVDAERAFHAKGYIFNKDHYQTILIGSSNLTSNALNQNYEWNLKLSSQTDGKLTEQINQQIEEQWQGARPLNQEWIVQYTAYYHENAALKTTPNKTFVPGKNSSLVPNRMQQAALFSLTTLRKEEKRRGLIISATGTGKTYLAAFDVQNYHPQKFLFVVHREQILRKAMHSFKDVLGGSADDYGVLSGGTKEIDRKYVFATIQTLSRPDILAEFDSETFDYILIDEAHKAGATTYQKVINHFTPQFLLGMTATPERTDDFNIYELFDYNIAYEIRLQDAIEENMLSQFHYIGITDYEYDGQMIDDNAPLKHLVAKERMDYVEQQIDYYGHDGNQVYGLIFCSRTEEALEIAQIMTAKGHPSVALTGSDSVSHREAVVNQFENGEIEYIVTVDIFNEGIDIPKINQVIMLRNTESSIIFIQQLGRGLRKNAGKEFVTIIDFIGNYKNNYMIPIALTGDQTLNKNSLRNKISINQTVGLSSINFSEIARERIYNSINNSNLTLLTKLRDSYIALKNKLGRIPLLADFQTLGSTNAQIFVDKYENYHQFLLKMHDDQPLTTFEDSFLRLISREFLNGMRIHELILLQKLFTHQGKYSKTNLITALTQSGTYTDLNTITSVENHLNLTYYQPNDRKKYGDTAMVILVDDFYCLNDSVWQSYATNSYFKSLVDDVITTGFINSKNYDSSAKFTLYRKYTRRQVNSLLGWPADQSSAIYGYKEKMGYCPMFVTYQKREGIPDELNHNNIFYNSSSLSWYTKSPRRLDSNEVVRLLDGNRNDEINLLLFVKKSDDEGSDFYYLGQVDFDFDSVEQQSRLVKGKEKPIVKANLKLRTAVNYNLYLDLTN
jgi:superfamily II DNA or RNA helicase/HKD family nuclease